MSEQPYTPTADEVRDAAGLGATALTPEEFDRWLAATVRAAKAEAWDESAEEVTEWFLANQYQTRENGLLDPPPSPYRNGVDQ